MKLKMIVASCLALGLAAGACGNVDEDGGASSPTANAQMALNADLLGGSDVAGFKFELTRVKCKTGATIYPKEQYSAKESLEEMYLPGHNETFEGGPKDEGYDEYSEHHFSDHLFTVPYGCYDVKAIPVDKRGHRSDDCAIAVKRKQKAIKNAFTELHLISQCRGQARRSVDVVASLNHPPEVDIDIEKFMCAGAGVRVCATASDPDDDPLRFYWKGTQPGCFLPVPGGQPTYDKTTGKTTHCVTIPSHYAESRDYKVVVKDLAWDDDHYRRVPIEKLLAEQDNYGHGFDADKSRAELHFRTHSIGECIEPAMAFIGVTLGADLSGPNDKTPNTMRGMSRKQAKKLAANAIDWVNPNKMGNPNPDILLVRDTASNEDEHEDNYIEGLLEDAGFTNVVRIDEPSGGLRRGHVVGFDIVWFVNPGYPLDDDKSYNTLFHFRRTGGGVIVSGDDANQNVDLSAPRDMSYFSFLEFKDYLPTQIANGERACGELTDGNAGKNYKVKFTAGTPLTKGMWDLDFPYGNDIDRNKRLYKGEIPGAYTQGLTTDPHCIGWRVPVITAIPSPLSL